MSITVTLPLRTVSEANAHEHWRNRQRRAKGQRSATRIFVGAHLRAAGVHGSVVRAVTLVRIAPRRLDSDNAVGALKHVRDGVADALGVKDNDPRIEWLYGEQERGKPRQYGVRITVEATS